jgi:arylamine N-acetyltransferase
VFENGKTKKIKKAKTGGYCFMAVELESMKLKSTGYTEAELIIRIMCH